MDRGGADPFEVLKEATEEYTVYDSHYEKIGKVDDLIVDEDDRVLYVGVKMGFLGTSSTLVPAEIIRVNDRRRLIEVSEPAETVRHAPHFGRSEDLTPELDNHVRTYFGLEALRPSPEHEARDTYSTTPPGFDEQVDLAPGERAASQERSFPAPGDVERTTPEEQRPEEVPSERAEDQQPISEPLSGESKGLWERLTTGGGVTVHRLKR